MLADVEFLPATDAGEVDLFMRFLFGRRSDFFYNPSSLVRA
jgi:hypothetical protein